MYCIVMYNMSTIQKGVQASHSIVEYALKYGNDSDFKEYGENDKTLIILNGGGSIEMSDIVKSLEENGIKFSYFTEEDFNGSITSVCFLADERVWNFKDYPDIVSWHEKKFGCIVMADGKYLFGVADKEYEEFIGGKKNMFLRELVSNKRLAQ